MLLYKRMPYNYIYNSLNHISPGLYCHYVVPKGHSPYMYSDLIHIDKPL
jgi:hypothetical protein